MQELAGLCIWNSHFLDNVIEELSTTCMLHDEVQLVLGLDDLIKLDDIPVANLLENLDFTSDPINVCLVLDLALFEYFDCNLFASDCLYPKLDFSECSLAQRLRDHEMRDLLQVSFHRFLRLRRLSRLWLLCFTLSKNQHLERFLFLS